MGIAQPHPYPYVVYRQIYEKGAHIVSNLCTHTYLKRFSARFYLKKRVYSVHNEIEFFKCIFGIRYLPVKHESLIEKVILDMYAKTRKKRLQKKSTKLKSSPAELT